MSDALLILALALLAAVEPLPPEATPLPALPPTPTAQALRLPAPVLSLVLDDAVAIALKNNPEVARACAQVEQAGGTVRTARGRLLPTVSAIYSYQSNPQAGFSIAGAAVSASQRTAADPARQTTPPEQTIPGFNFEQFIARHAFTISINQLLFDFGRTHALTEQARGRLAAAQQGLAASANGVAERVRDSFYALLQAEGLVAVQRANLDTRRISLRDARARFEAGTAPYGDLARATASVAQAQAGLARAQAAAERARVALNQAMGIDPKTLTGVQPATEPEPALPPLDRLLEEAYTRRPELRQAEQSIHAEKEGLRAARKGNLPAINGSIVKTYRGRNAPTDSSASGVGLTAIWNAFDFGITKGQVETARGLVADAEAALRQTQLQVGAAVTQAYQDVQANEEIVANARVAVASARESLRVARARYAVGLAALVDVTDAEAALVSAETDRVNAEYDLSRARAALAYALGPPGSFSVP